MIGQPTLPMPLPPGTGPLRALDRGRYRLMRSDELQRRYCHLASDHSAVDLEGELGRMFALQEIAAVLIERQERLP